MRGINQTCALQTGCFPGDAAGFRVSISDAGSYRLTGNLSFSATLGPSTSDFIEVTGDRVTLDLNGFELRGSFPLTGNPCGRGTFVGILNGGSTATEGTLTEGHVVRDNGAEGIIGTGMVRNDVVSGNAGDGISAAQAVIEGNTVRSNEGDGIAAAISALVANNVAVGNGGDGVEGVGDFSYRGNMISGNSLGAVSVSAGAALNTGGNARNASLVCP